MTSPFALHPLDLLSTDIEIPSRFTYPFCYEAHPLAILAATKVQDYLSNEYDNLHNFGTDPNHGGLVIGKMFGVLVIKDKNDQLGFLAAYSGKLADGTQHPYFVPSVFDIYKDEGFYRSEERNLVSINMEIEALENSTELKNAQLSYENTLARSEAEIKELRHNLKVWKRERQDRRDQAIGKISEADWTMLLEQLKNESLKQQYDLKVLLKHWDEKLKMLKHPIDLLEKKIETLKEERKHRSSQLQNKLFSQYRFLNAQKEWKSLLSIFKEDLNILPPAGAGECAAPKLLQYAYLNDLQPITMAEFWWGQSPKSEVRRHGDYYPACKGKCGPILGFMLQGLSLDPNPLEENPAEGKELEIIYEDHYLMVINKPAEFLSVPGKVIQDSVQSRILKIHPEALLVHRLDQSTSGIILIAKNHEIHARLQQQFIKRTVKKRYMALLDGYIEQKSGLIDLPLRVDLDNRPQQMVCHEYGKAAQTKYEIISHHDGKTLVYFYPITGRTHQLRVHASHLLGLNTPIVGDDLYGKKAERLMLHAESLEFTHPISKERIIFKIDPSF